MNKIQSFLFSLVLTSCFMLFSQSVQAWDWCEPLDMKAEFRVAYYHPSSHRVRRIYRDGWADYQLEISKSLGYNCRVWTGVSGFSRRGESIGFHDDTRLSLIPISLGLKYDYTLPFDCRLKAFIGGAASYSFLRIHDHSKYVHEHTRREDWGGVIQSGMMYDFCEWGFVSVFADYFFQYFDFHNTHKRLSHHANHHYSERFIERHDLDLSGYKIGVGLGLIF